MAFVPDDGLVSDVLVSTLVGGFGVPNSGSTTFEGTSVKVTGIGTDAKTVTRTDKDGKVTVVTAAPVPAAAAATDVGTAVMNLINKMKALAAAKEESRSAHRSLDSIVNSDNLPDDVKANIPDAINRASDADKNLKAATQDVQKALIDLQQQVSHG